MQRKRHPHPLFVLAPVIALTLAVSAGAAPVPSVALDVPAESMLGEQVRFTLTFDNAGDAPGYGPWIDLVLPLNGADGAAGTDTPDGLSFVSATHLGVPLATTVLAFPDDGGGLGCVDHPFAVDSAHQPLQVCGTTGDVLVVLRLPFGSVVPQQPTVTVEVVASMSQLADAGHPLAVHARGGFQYGADPLDNPCCDLVIADPSTPDSGSWPGAATVPVLMRLSKIYLTPGTLGEEAEGTVGPAYPRSFRVVVDLADGQTMENLELSDILPGTLQFVAVEATLVQGNPVSTTAVSTPSTTVPGGTLTRRFPPVTGDASEDDLVMAVAVYVPPVDAGGQPVIPPGSCASAPIPNEASALGDWDPVDPRDAGGTDNAAADPPGPESVLTARTLPIQKAVTVAVDGGAAGPSPGDVLEYTLEFQVSDVMAFDGLVVNDIVLDGQRLDTSFIPTLEVREHGATTGPGPFDATNFTVMDHFTGGSPEVPPLDGTQEIEFRVSDQMVLEGLGAVLLGACVPPGGTGGGDPDCSVFSSGQTRAVLHFRTVIQEEFTDDFPSGDPSVDQGDVLGDTVTVAGRLLDPVDLTPTGSTCTDDSSASVEIARGTVSKELYAVNGSTSLPSPLEISPGDTVTYRISYALATSDFENLVVTDFLPLPVFEASEVTTLDSTVDGTVPPAGTVKYGPGDTFHAYSGLDPALATDALTNTVILNFGNFDSTGDTATVIDLLFTVTVTDEPFADGLQLVNLVRVQEGSTNSGDATTDDTVPFTLREPYLAVRKGVCNTDNPDETFDPPLSGGGCPGTLTSSDLDADPDLARSDVSGVDVGDLLTFTITIENQGGSGAFDVTLHDVMPPGMRMPGSNPAQMNLSIVRGDGFVPTWTPLGPGGNDGDLFGDGLLLDDSGGQPLCQPHDPVAGSNVLTITYQLEIFDPALVPETLLVNGGGVTSFAGTEGGPSHVDSGNPADFTDSAVATLASPVLEKTLAGTEIVDAANGADDAVIGEYVIYQLVVRVPEATLPAAAIVDTLDGGLAFVDVLAFTVSPDVTVATPIGTGTNPANVIVDGSGGLVTFDLGDVVNTNRDNTVDEVVTIVYRAVVLDQVINQEGGARNNEARLSWTGGTTGAVSAPVVRILEPAIMIDKSATPTEADAGDAITYTITVSGPAGSDRADAHDVLLGDTVPAGMTYVPGSLAAGSCTVVPVLDDTGAPTLTASWSTFPVGASCQITYQAVVDPSVNPDQQLPNTASMVWSSLPGSPGQRSVHNADSTERDGSGGVDDYAAADTATVTVRSPDLTKVVASTSEASTGTGEHDTSLTDLVVGETVTYRITATLPEGTIPQVVITDSLPANATGVLQVVSATPVSVGGSLAVTNDPPDITTSDLNLGDGIEDTVVFDYGPTVNNPDGVEDDGDRIVVEIVARVVDVPANADGHVLTNTALLQYGSGLQASATVDVELVEPVLALQKSASPATGDAGDMITFTLDLRHAGASTAEAFDLGLDDTIPAGMSYVAGSLDCTGGTVVPVSCTESGGVIAAAWDEFLRGETTVITFQVTLDSSVQPEEVITNTAGVIWDTLPADGDPHERDGAASDQAQVTITAPGVTKAVTATSVPATGTGTDPDPDLTIGERVTFEITVTMPEGTTTDARIVDDLPTAPGLLGVVSSRITAMDPDMGSSTGLGVGSTGTATDPDGDGYSERVTFDFGTLTNGVGGSNTITVEVVAVVPDVPVNQGGVDDLVNTATTLYTGGNPVLGTAVVDLAAPRLRVTKEVVDPATPFGDAGDLITYRITVEHTAASSAVACDVTVADLLPPEEIYQVGSLTVVGGPSPVEDTSGLPSVVTYTWSTLDLADSPVIFEYTVQLDGSVEPSVSYGNTALLSWDTLPTGVPGDGGPDDRTVTDTDTADITINAPALVKITGVTSLGDTGTGEHDPAWEDLAIGEQVTYELTVAIPEGTTSGAVVTDAVQADGSGVLEAIGATVVSIGANLTTSLPGTPVFADNALGDGLADTVTFDFGTITNAADGVADEADRIRLEVTARVVDLPANADGVALVNFGTLAYATGGPVDDDASVDVVEPAMAVTKSMAGPVDGVVTLTVALANTGTAPAYDLVVSDAMPAAMWDTGSISPVSVPVGFTFSVVGAPGDATVTMASDPNASPPDSSVEPGETVVLVFTAAVPGGANPPATTLTNTADNTVATTLPGIDPDEREEPDVQGTAQLLLPSIELDKSWSIAPGGDLDGSGSPSPGDVLRYSISVRNAGPGTATGLAVTDPITDPNLTLVTGSVTAGGGGVVVTGNTAGDTSIRVVYATFAGGGNTAVITCDVQVADPVAAGVNTLVNWASADCDQLPAEPSDDPGTPADDDPTVVPLDAVPDIAVAKDDGLTEVRPGDTVTWTLTVSNVGNQNATGVVLTDTVPPGTSFVSASDGATESGGIVTWPAFGLAAGTSVQRTLAVLVDDPAPPGQATVVNTAQAADDGSNGQDPDPGNNEATDSDTLVHADLAVTKSDSPDPVRAGEQVTYTLVVTNNGPATEPAAVVTDTLPAGFTFVSAVPGQGSCSAAGGVVTCTLGSLAMGDAATVTVVCDVPSGTPAGSYTNTAAVSGSESDPVPANDSASEDTTVVEEADLAVVKTDSPDPVRAGEQLTWTLEVSNNGPSDATGVTVTDVLPAGVSVVSADPACTESSGTVTCTTATLADGDSVTFHIVVTVDPGTTGALGNTATVTADQTDPVPDNDSDSEDTTVTTLADLAVIKTGPATVARGSDLDETIMVTNTGPSDAVNVVLSDPTPGGLVFVAAAAPCVGGFPCALSDLPAGGSVSLTVTYHVPADYAGADPILNTASVSSDTPDPRPEDNADDAATAVDRVPECDVAVLKAGPPSAAVGSTVTYGLHVVNNGPDGAENVVLDDTTPPGLVFVEASAPCTAGFPCTLGDLDPGDVMDLSLTFQVPMGHGGSQIVNTATVSTDTADTDPGNDSSTVTTPIGAETTDLTVDKQGPVAAAPGDNIVYTVSVSNLGPGDATGVAATDTFPGDVTWLADTCGGDFQDGVWNIGALAAGSSATCEITAHVDLAAAGPQANSVVVSGTEPESDTTNNDDAVVTGLGAPAADVGVVKAGPARAYPGGTLTFALTVVNHGPGSALDVVLDDTTPPGLVFVEASAPCTGGFPCTLGDLAAGSAVTVGVSFQVPTDYAGVDPIVNTASVSTTSQDTDSTNDTDDATVDFIPEADLSVVKDDGLTTAVPGTPLTYTIVVANAGPGDVVGGTVTDVFPATLLAPSWSCVASAGATCGSGTGNITDVVSIPQGGTLTYTVTSTVAPDATGDLVNTATVTMPPGMVDPDPDDNTSTDVDVLVSTADLGVTKTDLPDPVVAGTGLAYTLAVVNNGPSTATGVTVVDTLPSGVTLQSATPSQGSCSTAGNVVTCTLGVLAPSGTAGITLTAEVDPAATGTLTNTVTVSGDGTDPVPDNDADTEPTVVLAEVDLALLKTDSPDPVEEGQELTWILHVANAGPSDATGVVITDVLPPQVVFVSASPGCTEAGGTVTCTVGTVPAGSSQDLEIVVGVPWGERGPLANSATVSGEVGDTDPSNDTDDETTTVLYSNLDLVKTASPPPNGEVFLPGEEVTWTITATNSGTLAADPATLVDRIPRGLGYVAGSMVLDGVPLTDDADGDSGSYDVVSGTLNVSMAPVPAGGSSTLVFRTRTHPAEVPGEGSVANQATLSLGGDREVVSDDPATDPDDDPTVVMIQGVPIPMLGGFGTVVLVLLLLGCGPMVLRRF